MPDHHVPRVEDGMVVTLRYALRDDSGEELGSSAQSGPLSYVHGVGAVLPGIEQGVEGHVAGDQLSLVLTPDEAYGTLEEVPHTAIPRHLLAPQEPLEPGRTLALEVKAGEIFPVWVHDADAQQVVLSPRHPLAGRTIKAELEVLSVREAEPEELERGQPRTG